MKILFVDDDAQLTKAWKRIFSQHPEVVISRCRNTEEALSTIEQHHPDIIFLDHELEDGKVGLKIAKQLRLQTNPPTIYSTSSYAEMGEIHDQYAEIGVEYVGKNLDSIRDKIKELLEK